MTTFGFELEFEENAELVANHLFKHTEGLIGKPGLCRYHCDCNYCYNTNIPLRAQTDSSCSGEIISNIMLSEDMSKLPQLLSDIQTAAVEVDAVPGFSSGMHVHVARPRLDNVTRGEMVEIIAGLEGRLQSLARGRFEMHRSNNTRIVDAVNDIRYDWDSYGKEDYDSWHDYLYVRYNDMDRHINLCTRTRHNTWEFRIWNSTRSAWRMEMNIRLSLLLINYEFLIAAKETSTLDEFIAVVPHFDPTLHELLVKQADYISNNPNPPGLTELTNA